MQNSPVRSIIISFSCRFRIDPIFKTVLRASVEGVGNVLNAISKNSSIQTFVHISSEAAVHRRQCRTGTTFSEADWNDWATMSNDPYGYAKTEAEKLVWEFSKNCPARLRIRILNPCVIIGPVMAKRHTKASAVFLREAIYNNSVAPAYVKFVDVRDVAVAAQKALELQTAETHRFLLAADAPAMRLSDLGDIAQRQLPQYQLRTPARFSPVFVWILVLISSVLYALPLVGRFFLGPLERSTLIWREELATGKAKRMLGVRFRPIEDTVKEGVESMIDQGFVKPKMAVQR